LSEYYIGSVDVECQGRKVSVSSVDLGHQLFEALVAGAEVLLALLEVPPDFLFLVDMENRRVRMSVMYEIDLEYLIVGEGKQVLGPLPI
jgi:hypothetical protein